MTTTTNRKATRTTTSALDLDTRLALVDALMSVRLDNAGLAHEVRTAHIPAADPLPEITTPITPPAGPCPYSTPIAAVLHHARVRLETGGWCTGALRDEDGARCLVGAIQAVAANQGQAQDACSLLLEVIRRDFPDVETVPSWNDAQRGVRLPLLYLDRAAACADARGL